MKSRVLSEAEIEKYKDSVIITHSHTHGSDGNISERDALIWAFQQNCFIYSNSEHDRADYKFYKEMGWGAEELKNVFHEVKGLWISDSLADKTLLYVQSLELTTFDFDITNDEGKPTKCHLLLIAPDLSTKNELVELIMLKGQNDDDYDMGMLTCLYKYRGVAFPKDIYNDFKRKERARGNRASRVNKKMAVKYFQEYPEEIKKLGIPSLTVVRRLLSKFEKHIVRINIPIQIAVSIAHKAGAFVFVPHLDQTLYPLPEEKWRPFIRHLFDVGVDGICLKEIQDEEVKAIALDEIQKCEKPLINDGGGPDCHTMEDYLNAGLSKYKIVYSMDAVNALNDLQKAREQGKISYMNYQGIDIQEFNTFMNFSRQYIRYYLNDIDETLEKAKWENALSPFRDKTTKDCYDAEILVGEYLQDNPNVSSDVLNYAMTLKNISIDDFYDMMNGRFQIPESEPSVKEKPKNMVSKPAPRFSNNGKDK